VSLGHQAKRLSIDVARDKPKRVSGLCRVIRVMAGQKLTGVSPVGNVMPYSDPALAASEGRQSLPHGPGYYDREQVRPLGFDGRVMDETAELARSRDAVNMLIKQVKFVRLGIA